MLASWRRALDCYYEFKAICFDGTTFDALVVVGPVVPVVPAVPAPLLVVLVEADCGCCFAVTSVPPLATASIIII